MSTQAAIAAIRFGLGPRPGELREARDARGWLRAQLSKVEQPARLASSGELIRQHQRLRRRGSDDSARKRHHRDVYRRETAARERLAVRTARPLVERWVAAWSNHFTVSTTQPRVTGLVGAFEREAIRPHVLGRFEDLLVAVVRHPAMLLYLDNARSIGPRSEAGRRREAGLNENLARELLELHTLGVDGGYDQSDVEAASRVLTGWSIDKDPVADDAFRFHDRAHEPGDKRVLGSLYGPGESEGRRMLHALARHPSTARNVARRLARHFVADAPPASAVAKLERTFLETEGDLLELARAVIDLEEAWQVPLSKLKTPRELVISTARAIDFEGDGERLVRAQRRLGQLPFAAPSPQGWPDDAPSWAGPLAVLDRVDWAEDVAARHAPDDAVGLAEHTLGPLLSSRTRRAIASVDGPLATATLLASPEHQRR